MTIQQRLAKAQELVTKKRELLQEKKEYLAAANDSRKELEEAIMAGEETDLAKKLEDEKSNRSMGAKVGKMIKRVESMTDDVIMGEGNYDDLQLDFSDLEEQAEEQDEDAE